MLLMEFMSWAALGTCLAMLRRFLWRDMVDSRWDYAAAILGALAGGGLMHRTDIATWTSGGYNASSLVVAGVFALASMVAVHVLRPRSTSH